MYKDAILKIDFYKSQIMQELTKRGIYPDMVTVQSRIDDIDDRLSIFRHTQVTSRTDFDTEKFNIDLLYIWQDLYFLYKLVHELSVRDYVSLKSYVDCHMTELEDMAQAYSYRTQLEISSTSLGKTIFFQASGYNIAYKDNTAVVSLGPISVTKGSRLACVFESTNATISDVIFSFDGANCSPYSYNKDFFKVPGEAKTATYNYSLPADSAINSLFQLNIANFTPKADSQYVVFGGKDTIAVYDASGSQTLIAKEQGSPCVVNTAGRIEFYVYGGSFINFDFSEQPLSKNFTDTTINNLKKRHKIIIECDSSFTFNFITDGQAYAVREDGIIKDSKLYYPNAVQLVDFLIEESLPGEKVTYSNVKVTVADVGTDPVAINTIAIKELSSLEVLSE